MAIIEIKHVAEDEANMRLDNWFKQHYPALAFGQLQKLLRSGQIRVEGKRAKSNMRLEAGQKLRIPPLAVNFAQKPLTVNIIRHQKDRSVLEQMLLYEDPKLFVFNKPAGLAVQGGSGVVRHIDAMLESWRNKKGERPRLVHRIDRETSGILVVARSRLAAQKLAVGFRERSTKKLYWSLVRGVPAKKQAKISTWLVRQTGTEGDKMVVCAHGVAEAVHAVSYYRVIETAGRALSWLEMEPHTGRTHQLRVHSAHIDHPIIGDAKYFHCDQNWVLMRGIQNKLHLHARYIRFHHPDGGMLEFSAPLSAHMQQSFNLLGFDSKNEQQ